MGVAVAECTQIVGVLLVFTLMVGPASAAQNISPRFGWGIGLAALIALLEAWSGIALSWETNWPTSFWITLLSGAVYLASLGWTRARQHLAAPRPQEHPAAG